MNDKREHPKVFISYSWEDKEHKEWALKLVDRLIGDGVDAHIDQYELSHGDRLPQFMEQEIVNADYVLIICTPNYKEKADNRKSGVGYEGHIISDELMQGHNEKKFIPIIRKGGIRESFPIYLAGKLGIDFKDDSKFEVNYEDLLATIYGKRKKPQLGTMPTYIKNFNLNKNIKDKDQEIKIMGIITNKVTVPKLDGTMGSALYKIPFKLSRIPSNLWKDLFIEAWNMPPRFTTMHRAGIARVVGDEIILDGTTIDEVKKYHRDTLLLCVEQANKKEKEIIDNKNKIEREKQLQAQEHYQKLNDTLKEIEW